MASRFNGNVPYIPSVSLSDYDYELPAECIAAHPAGRRGTSRLLVCSVEGTIAHHSFEDVVALVPGDALLVLNVTRVVRARIPMRRTSGGRVELFLLEPADDVRDPALALARRGESSWMCLAGGARKFAREGRLTGNYLLNAEELTVTAALRERIGDTFLVDFSWTPATAQFADVLEAIGGVPLPPYIKREAAATDAVDYQTVYAQKEGAVAAPTAGLHFTPDLLAALQAKGVRCAELTLHVGAGTFRQVKGAVAEHDMHAERIEVSAETLRVLLEHARLRERGGAPFVVVGTTGVRTLESLYWFGVRAIAGEASGTELVVEQWDPYRLAAQQRELPTLAEALAAVETWRREHGLATVSGATSIIIVPGYAFRACDALITNFHQPGSTLVLLVGALLGRELFRKVYSEALREGYRFLSFGDSSMLIADPARMGRG